MDLSSLTGCQSKLHKTLLFCVDGFATDYGLICRRACCWESSFTPVSHPNWTMFLWRADQSFWCAVRSWLSQFGPRSFRCFMEDRQDRSDRTPCRHTHMTEYGVNTHELVEIITNWHWYGQHCPCYVAADCDWTPVLMMQIFQTCQPSTWHNSSTF